VKLISVSVAGALKLIYFGHVLTESADCLEEEIVESTMAGNEVKGGH